MGRKVSDGWSVKVTVPISTTIVAGDFFELDGFIGIAFESLVTDGATTSDVALGLDLAEYETSQITVADAFVKGATVYWDGVTDLFTDVAGALAPFGKVTVAKDANDVIWFKRTAP